MDNVKYAGFWKRVAAHIIDNICLTGLGTGIGFVLVIIPILLHVPEAILILLKLLFLLTSLVSAFCYFTVLESSEKQGTCGKQIMKLKVVNADGERITFLHATGRLFSRLLTTIANYILFSGVLIMLFTPRKQVLHDLITSTVVIEE